MGQSKVSFFTLILRVVLVLTGCGFVLSLVPPQNTVPTTTLNFEATDLVVEGGPKPEICSWLNQKNGSVLIYLEVKPNTFSNWQNIFQTSDVNNGVRLEVNSLGIFGVLVRDTSEKQNSFVGVSSSNRLIKHQINKIEVLFSETGEIILRLNGMIEGILAADTNPRCDNFRLGIGFDDSRKFDGTVSILITSRGTPRASLFGLPIFLRTILQFISIVGLFLLSLTYLVFQKYLYGKKE